MRSMSLVVDLIDLVTKHKSGELRCPATALIVTKMSTNRQKIIKVIHDAMHCNSIIFL